MSAIFRATAAARGITGRSCLNGTAATWNINIVHPQRASCGQVIALHCSGADASEWRDLSKALGDGHVMRTPEHYGCESSGQWTGEHAFTIADEAAKSLALIDESEEKVHLVGHSYGGGVALHVALSRPDRIASMSLYEPSAFHLLRQMGEAGAHAYTEIQGVARSISHCVTTGDYRAGITDFVDYWNGHGAWKAMRPGVQNALIRWAPKAPLDFHALIDDPTAAKAYAVLKCPVLIMRGEHAPMPSRVIAEGLSELLPISRLTVIDGAGHMGPLTHARDVSALIARHIVDAETGAQPRRCRRRSEAEILGVAARPAEAVS
jgi:pimeloyl-ACP methyl ester carboxylesterase